MIISASRRTDIPAFNGENFLNSFLKGEFVTENPFNKRKKTITFNKNELTGIVFWSKNPEKFINIAKVIKNHNVPFYFQYTINNYPKDIEPEMPPLQKRIDIFHELFDTIKPFPIVWRYDPIILTENLDEKFHFENFCKIAEEIGKYINNVTVAPITIYRKIKKFFPDIADERRIKNLIKKMDNKIKKYGKQLDVCCFKVENIASSKCVNGKLLNKNFKENKHVGQRSLCNCDKSIDVGFYRTCKHNCLYCYAR
jgi:DNA repair photolyase